MRNGIGIIRLDVPIETQRAFKAGAALAGLTLGAYFEQLVTGTKVGPIEPRVKVEPKPLAPKDPALYHPDGTKRTKADREVYETVQAGEREKARYRRMKRTIYALAVRAEDTPESEATYNTLSTIEKDEANHLRNSFLNTGVAPTCPDQFLVE